MSHPLPLAPPAPSLHGRVEVFDPAMCCPMGLCGPGVDPALLAISRDLRWLEKQGVEVARVGLATAPDAFVADARVAALLRTFGDAALPATFAHGAVVAHGRYPTRAELVAALASAPPRSAPPHRPPPDGSRG